MKNLVICLIASGASAFSLFIVYVFLATAPAPEVAAQIVITSRTPEDILSVSVDNEYGSFRFYFDLDENGFVVDGIPPHLVDLSAFYSFLQNSAVIVAISGLSADDSNLQDFGLAPPRAAVEIEFFDGATLNLGIGEAELISGNYYMSVDGYDDVFIISAVVAEQFLRPRNDIISMSLTPPLGLSSPLSAVRDITFSGTGLSRPVTIVSTADADEETSLMALSFGIATHIVQSEGVYGLDQAYGITLFEPLFNLRAVDILAYNLSYNELSDFGLDEPYIAVDFDMISGIDAPIVPVSLRFAQADDGLYYATRMGSGAVYLVGRLPFFDIEFERLVLRWFLTPFLMDLSSITVSFQYETFRFEIDASDTRDIRVYHDGQPLDMELFHVFFRLITSAAHDGVFLGTLEQGDGTPLLTIKYEYTHPDKNPDVLTLFPGDVRRANVFINGIGEFSMNDLFIRRVTDGAKNLIAGNTIEADW